MDERELYLLLHVIKKNGDIKKLVREGIDYKRIAELTSEAISKKLVLYKNDEIELSDLGNSKYDEIKGNYKKNNKAGWIAKDDKSQTAKLDKNAIFVPRQDELTF